MEKPEENPVRTICTTAVLAALIFVLTYVPKIPIPLGYAHLGDAAIFLAILFADKRNSAIAASLGSALADLIGGFPLWIIPTLFIKWIMVEIVFRVMGTENRSHNLHSGRTLLAFTLSSLWMAAAYTIAGGLLYGSMGAALASTPGLVMEGVINTIVAIVAGTVLQKAGIQK